MKLHRGMLHTALLFVALCLAASAQDTGSITGTVKDPSGAAVPNADVVVTNPDHGIDRHTASNSGGDYNESALPGGTYDVIVTAPGFKKYQAKGVKLDVAQKARVDVALQLGAVSEVLEVQGTQVAQVETQSSDLTGTVTGKQITQLELNGRNFTQLITLVPGVSNQTGQDEGTVGVYGNVAFSVNGGRTEYNNWELDGGDNMDNGSNETLNVYPSLDAIAEFKVLTSNYGAQYGRNGSGTVEVETKSGTNRFHGDVYEFVRNDAFNARNYFLPNVPPYKKNDYGYTVGGPIWKNHTFFFWSQEWRRDRVPGQNFNQPVPSVEERTGNFSDQCPGSNCPVQPATLADGSPNPNAGNVITPVPLWTNAGSFPTIQTAFKGPGVALVARLSSTFSPTLLNEFVFSYTTDHIILNNVGNWKRSSFAGFTVPDIFPGNGNGILPGINLVTSAYGGGFGEDAGYIERCDHDRKRIRRPAIGKNLQLRPAGPPAQVLQPLQDCGTLLPGRLAFNQSSNCEPWVPPKFVRDLSRQAEAGFQL